MRSTVKIMDDRCIGSGFVIARAHPQRRGSTILTLVTSKFILQGVKAGDIGVVYGAKDRSGRWTREEKVVFIRDGTKPLWTEHPTADVAALNVDFRFGDDVTHLDENAIADDEELDKWGITAGTELNCLGYPKGNEGNSTGFPILRCGKVASFPITPTDKYPKLIFEITPWPGYRGGPIYFSSNQGGVSANGIVGLDSGLMVSHMSNMPYIVLGLIVPGRFIKETLALTPAPRK